MNLLSIFCDEKTNTVEATWTDDNGKRIRCHIYSDRQMSDLRADLGKDAAEHEDLIALVEANIKPLLAPSPEQLAADKTAVDAKDVREDAKFQALIAKTPQQVKNWVQNSFPTLTLPEQRDLATIIQAIGVLGRRL